MRQQLRQLADDLDAEKLEREPGTRKRPAFMAKVLVYDLRTENCVREYERDFNMQSTRKWLHRLHIWALNNQLSVEVLSAFDDGLLRLRNDAKAG